MARIFRLEWEAYEKGIKLTKSGYFIKVGSRYFQIFYDDSHLEMDDNKVNLIEEVEMNVLGKFKKLKRYD